MMVLKGYRLRRLLGIAQASAWAMVGLLMLMVGYQLVGLAESFGGDMPLESATPARSSEAETEGIEMPPVERFAVIWEGIDPKLPAPVPEPAPVVTQERPRPPAAPDPYPAMRLIGTITGQGTNCALLHIRPSITKMLREGETFEDIHLVEVSESEVTVKVRHATRTLRIENEPGSGVRRHVIE